jgi:hypothetical protein
MEVEGYTVGPQDCGRMILLVGLPKTALRHTHVLRYIEWGESKGWHKGETCAARVSQNSFWYDLTKHRRPQLILPKIQQYRLQAFINPSNLYQNSSLLGIYVANSDEAMNLAAILNSSLAVLSRILFARVLGNEGNIQLDVYSAKMMLVPVLSNEEGPIQRAVEAFRRMIERPALQFLSERRMRRMSYTNLGRERELAEISDSSELDMDDRRGLDDAVLEMLGIESSGDRQVLLNRLYDYLREFFEEVRQKEELAIANKNKSKRRAALTPADMAVQILADIKSNNGQLLRAFRDFVDIEKANITLDLPALGLPEVHEDIFARDGSVRFMKGRKQIALLPTKNRDQAALVAMIALHGVRGLTRVPLYPPDCVEVRKRHESFVTDRDKQLRAMITDRTGDPEFQEEVFQNLSGLIQHEING